MVGWIADFFNPDAAQQQQQQGKKQQVKQQQQQQAKTQQVKQKQQQTTMLPPLTQTSTLFKQQQAVPQQLTQAIVQQVNKQAQQSRQQLAKLRQQQARKDVMEQATKAHDQVLSYARQARTLVGEIKTVSEQLATKRQQTQQSIRLLKKHEKEAAEFKKKLEAVLDQMLATRQQSKRAQAAHLTQLRQVRQTLVDQMAAVQPIKKVMQYDTPDGNKVRVQLSMHPDTKCCVAQSLTKKSPFAHVE